MDAVSALPDITMINEWRKAVGGERRSIGNGRQKIQKCRCGLGYKTTEKVTVSIALSVCNLHAPLSWSLNKNISPPFFPCLQDMLNHYD